MKKELYILGGLAILFVFVLVLPAHAGTLEQVTVTPSTSQGGISGNYLVDFVVASSTEVQSQIRLIFPAGFNVTGATATSTTPSTTPGAIIASSTVSGQEVTLWLADGSVGTASTSMQVQADAIQSPYAGGSFTLGVHTLTLASEAIDNASSSAFTITENLTIEQATITPDSAYGGRVSNYTASFIVASSTEIESRIRLIFPSGFDVSSATATSSITASAAGSEIAGTSTVSGQEITIWLADGAVTAASDTIQVSGVGTVQSPYAGGTFTLGVETRTLANELSNSASSTSFTIIPSPNTPTPEDTAPPVSKITAPASGASIPSGKPYVIYGTGSDAAGTLVKTVEVSVDGGQTWLETQVQAAGGTYNWEYTWQNPTAGEYTIQVRATDAKGNSETPSAGVKVTVTGSVSPTTPPTPTPILPVAEKPIAQMTASELQAKITQLQQQLLVLLQQLIQILRAQL